MSSVGGGAKCRMKDRTTNLESPSQVLTQWRQADEGTFVNQKWMIFGTIISKLRLSKGANFKIAISMSSRHRDLVSWRCFELILGCCVLMQGAGCSCLGGKTWCCFKGRNRSPSHKKFLKNRVGLFRIWRNGLSHFRMLFPRHLILAKVLTWTISTAVAFSFLYCNIYRFSGPENLPIIGVQKSFCSYNDALFSSVG